MPIPAPDRHTFRMIRRTITLPEELAAAVDAAVEAGLAPNVSRFIQEAVRAHLRDWRHVRVAAEAARLDPAEEVRLATGGTPGAPAPWGRLGAPDAR